MPPKTQPLPVAVAGIMDNIPAGKFREKELNLINHLTDGVSSIDDWRESIFHKIMYVLPVPIGLVCLNGYVLAANEELQSFLGYSEAEIQNMRFDNFTKPQDRLPDRANFNKLINGDIDHYRMERAWRTKIGGEVYGKLVVVRIPWPKKIIVEASEKKLSTIGQHKMAGFPIAIAMVLTNDRGNEVPVFDPTQGNRKLFGIIPEWAIDKIGRMSWSQGLSLVFVLGSLVSIVGLLLHFIPNIIEVLTK